MFNTKYLYDNLLRIYLPFNICNRSLKNTIKLHERLIEVKENKPLPNKASVALTRQKTDTLHFGKILKDNPASKMVFPFFNPSKNNNFKLDTNDKILSTSIFEGGYRDLPSVKNILEQTIPPERKKLLDAWRTKMILKLGKEGFETYRQGLLDRGTNFHTCIELQLRKEEPSEEQLVGIENYWKSIKHIFPLISHVKLLESRVIHETLEYQGSIDCVGIYKNIPVIIEFKTSTKPKVKLSSTYDDPLQLAAYIGALNYDSSYDLSNISRGVLVIAYSTGLPAHVHIFKKEDCLHYWDLWLQRLKRFKELQLTKTTQV